MLLQIFPHLAIGIHDFENPPVRCPIALVNRSGGNKALNVKLVGIQKETNQRLRVIRFIFNVRQDQDQGFALENELLFVLLLWIILIACAG